MIELKRNALVFSFPEVHPGAKLTIDCQRTLRIPDDDSTYPLPPGLGRFPLRHVDDFADAVDPQWLEHGGVMMPMYQSEAMWLNFSPGEVNRRGRYPFAIKVAAGKVNAVTGSGWTNGLDRREQDYLMAPGQPWLDGFCVAKGLIRQFVATPLGEGYTAEEQITGRADVGGLQIVAYPMKRDVFERLFPERERSRMVEDETMFCLAAPAPEAMGLAPGGRMEQQIFEDPYGFDAWDHDHCSRCFVHLANSLVWRAITGQQPPTTPPTSKEYTKAGLPWFEYYEEDAKSLEGGAVLKKLRSIWELARHKRTTPLPENESVDPKPVVKLHKAPRNRVREGSF